MSNTNNEDPSNDDALESSEDFMFSEIQVDEDSLENVPNNDFCWAEEDVRNTSEATRHLKIYNEAWNKIRKLEGHTETVSSSNDGSIKWTVVREITDDVLKEVREKDELNFKLKNFPILQNMSDDERSKLDYKTGLWKLWPGTIEENVTKINTSIMQDNIRRKQKYQRPLKTINTSEFIIFNALLIAATAYNDRGHNLWADNRDMKKREGLSHNVDFGVHMKLWRFKEIKQFVSTLMKDEDKKKEHSWWRVKGMINKFIETRKEVIIASHTFVFDESMSAFVPR